MFTVKEVVTACSDVLSGCLDSFETSGRTWKLADMPEMTEWLNAASSEELRSITAELMRKVCSCRPPRLGRAYFRFDVGADCGYTFHGRWIGYDECGNDVRSASPVDSQRTISNVRELLGQTLYVLESAKELAAWQMQWHGIALIPERLARRAYPFVFKGEAKLPGG